MRKSVKFSEEEQKKIEQAFYITGASLAGFALILYLMHRRTAFPFEKILMPCMFHKFTGLYCPGCGGTRAVEAFFKGKWILSFLYHPIVPYGGIIYAWYMGSHTVQMVSRGRIKIGMHYRDAYLWIALGLTAANFFIKNLALILFHLDILEILTFLMASGR